MLNLTQILGKHINFAEFSFLMHEYVYFYFTQSTSTIILFMSKIQKVKNVSDYIENLGGIAVNRLIGIVDYAKLSPIPHSLNSYEVYGVFMHKHLPVDIQYGCGNYDCQNGGTIICVAPGQIGGKEDNGESINLDGWALLFHPDFLHGTAIGDNISKYTFFDYSINEALHTTPSEYDTLAELMQRIQSELQCAPDEQQNAIVADLVSLLLNYCKRFYNRQFSTRKIENASILNRFHNILDEYYAQELQFSLGLPTVSYCANKLCLSPGYLGDLLKRHTGDSAINYIHQYIMQKAKNRLSSGNSIADVAYSLGFDYPGHFSRLFKNREGISPSRYINRLTKIK